MTQYLMSVIHPEELDLTPDEMQEMFKAVDAFNEEMQSSGRWVFAGGLQPPSSATVVDATKGESIITDGPYVEVKEQLGGFWVLEAADLDEALDLAQRASVACKNPIEVRAFQGEG
jgi:hypothetical protein